MSHPKSRNTSTPELRGTASWYPVSGSAHPQVSDVTELVTGAVRARVQNEVSERLVRLDEESIRQLVLALQPRPPPRAKLGELAKGWLARVKRVRIDDEKRNVEMLGPLLDLNEETLTGGAIQQWFDQLLAMSYQPVSINKYRCAGKLIVREAQAHRNWGDENPFELVARLKEEKKKRELPEPAQVAKAIPQMLPEYRVMTRVAALTGIRSGELFALRDEDIDLNANIIHIRRSHERDTTKNDLWRDLPLLPELRGQLEWRVERGGLIFPNQRGSLRRADSKMSPVIRNALEFAGVNDPRLARVTWQDLRRCAATWHRRAGADRLAVKMMLGHRGDDVTDDHYLHMDMDWLRREMSKLGPVL